MQTLDNSPSLHGVDHSADIHESPLQLEGSALLKQSGAAIENHADKTQTLVKDGVLPQLDIDHALMTAKGSDLLCQASTGGGGGRPGFAQDGSKDDRHLDMDKHVGGGGGGQGGGHAGGEGGGQGGGRADGDVGGQGGGHAGEQIGHLVDHSENVKADDQKDTKSSSHYDNSVARMSLDNFQADPNRPH